MRRIISRKGVFLAAAIASGLGFAVPASAATEIVLCNKTGSKVQVALVFQDQTSGKWMLNAWKTRNPGECSSAGGVKTGLFYYYAEKAGVDFHWPAKAYVDKTYCVPAAAVLRPMGGPCGVGEKSYGFKGTVAGEGKYTLNFQ